jgi:hypothetical protein
MKSSSTAAIGKSKTSLGGVVKVDPSRRVIDMTAGEVDEIIAARLEEFLEGAPKPVDDGYMDRAGAAKFLDLSTAQIDKLCRDDGLPFFRVGDVKRFDKQLIRKWVEAQGDK